MGGRTMCAETFRRRTIWPREREETPDSGSEPLDSILCASEARLRQKSTLLLPRARASVPSVCIGLPEIAARQGSTASLRASSSAMLVAPPAGHLPLLSVTVHLYVARARVANHVSDA